MSRYQGQAQPHYVLTVTQTKYVCRERELHELLVRHFGQGIDFNISTKSNRWRYWAPRALTSSEVKLWIEELEARDARAQSQRNQATSFGSDSASTSAAIRPTYRQAWG